MDELREIRIRGARTHNLKNSNLDLPRTRLIVTDEFGAVDYVNPAGLELLGCQLEAALGWLTLQPAVAGDSEPGDEPGPVFLKGNQRTGLFHLRREDGLGEGILITGQAGSHPSAEDTWGPLPLDLFA